MYAAIALLAASTMVGEASVEFGVGGLNSDADIPDVSGIAFIPRLHLDLSLEYVRFDFDWAWVHARQSAGTAIVRAGNPTFTTSMFGQLGSVALSFGLGLAVPLATIGDRTVNARSPYAFFAARAVNGYRDAWLWTADSLALLMPLEVGARIRDARRRQGLTSPNDKPIEWDVYMGLAATGAINVPTTAEEEPSIGYQFAVDVRYEGVVTSGTRFQFARSNDQPFAGLQLSLAPYFSVDIGAWVVGVRGTITLYEPLGVRGDGDGSHAVFASVGYRLSQ